MDFLKTGFDIQRMDSFNYLKNNLVLGFFLILLAPT